MVRGSSKGEPSAGLGRLGEWELARWTLSLCPAAGEGGGAFASARVRPAPVVVPGFAADPERSRAEAARRAGAKLRRYCAANRLNRLGTLTFAGEGCHDPLLLRGLVGEFFRRLRALLGGDLFPYAWVSEWHKSGHGLHVHFAVGRYVPRSLIEQAWGHGFVHIKLLGDLPVGSGTWQEARLAARYLSKYVTKDFDGAQKVPGLHRYEVGQGFAPRIERLTGTSLGEVMDRAVDRMGAAPVTWWFSDAASGWQGPPAFWIAW